MAFSTETVQLAWRRSGGRCECERTTYNHKVRCNKQLVWENRGMECPNRWEAHSLSGMQRDTVIDCRIYCWFCHKTTF